MSVVVHQLLEVSEHARQSRVVLKGDLPIGVDRNSVDTWMYKSLFHMDTATGAPPDAFSTGGQNWGFPTYNWEEMSKDNYAWWRARLTQVRGTNVYRGHPQQSLTPRRSLLSGWERWMGVVIPATPSMHLSVPVRCGRHSNGPRALVS